MQIPSVETDRYFLQKTISDLTEEIGLLTMLQDMSKQLISKFDFDQIVDLFMDLVMEIIQYHSCILYLSHETGQKYQMVRHRGLTEEVAENYEPDDDIVDWILNEGRWTHSTFLKSPEPGKKRVVSILPLHGIKNIVGFLLVSSGPESDAFNPTNMKLLSFISSQAGIALENQDLYSKLIRSREYINNILESINNGIITVDTDDRITHINKNATAMLGLPSADIVGDEFRKAFREDLVEMIDREKKRALKDGFTFEILFEYCMTDAFSIPLGINSSLLIDDQGRRLGIIIVIRDMSASKELERLRQLDDLKSEFVSNVSHELRTPLSIIKTYIETLLEHGGDTDYETQQQFLTVVDQETDHLTGLVSDLLDISRIESGKYEMELVQISVSEVIALIVKKLENAHKTHDIRLDVPSDLPTLLADKEKIVQVFTNLIENAVKFSPKGGVIEISADFDCGMIVCRITDHGIGIAAADIPKIFEKFFRADISDKYEIPGTGLGLPIVKYIIESHNGEISAESELGIGSTFIVSIPVRGESAN
jgi:two-component system, OmpR family, sensor kinase